MSERVRRRRSRDVRVASEDMRRREVLSPSRTQGGLSPASRLRIAADVHRHSTSDDDSGCVLEEYAWVPSGLKPDLVHLYFSCLPDDKVPYIGSSGEKWRQRQLRHQLPPQDSDARYCAELTREEQEELRLFERGRTRECLGRGLVQQIPYDGHLRTCATCCGDLDEGDLAVLAPRTGALYHPRCFVCHECRALLVDLISFSHQGKIYCGRHHAEQIKPRCARCDELIFGEECTEAEGRTWHLHHFQCSDCGDVLGGKKYMQRHNKPVCLGCFHSDTSLSCATCRALIPVETPHISQGDVHWHADASCFCCCECQRNLLGFKYSLLDGQLYCGYNTCAGDDVDDLPAVRSPERRRIHTERRHIVNNNIIPSSPRAPRPPQRAPPSPPQENIYETVLPCTSTSPQFSKRYRDNERKEGNYYSKTPNGLRRDDMDSTSSSDTEPEDEAFYMANLLAAASLNRPPARKPQMCGVKTAKKKKSTRCIVS